MDRPKRQTATATPAKPGGLPLTLGAQGQSGERFWPNWLSAGRVAREERETLEKAMAWLDFMTLSASPASPRARFRAASASCSNSRAC